MTARPSNEELERRRMSPPAARDALRRQLEAAVTRWQWATGDIHSFWPAHRAQTTQRVR
jgi:hypothetical protein